MNENGKYLLMRQPLLLDENVTTANCSNKSNIIYIYIILAEFHMCISYFII